MHDDTTLDEALEFLAPFGPDLKNGMTSHAPMVVEALVSLGRSDAVLPWLERYRALLLPRPAPVERIDRDAWRGALGRVDRIGDWTAFFSEEFAAAPWHRVVGHWTAQLAPGICAAATHGVLRVAHAASSLARAESALRLDELARAFGYWAATYQTLPANRRSVAGCAPRSAAGSQVGVLARVARVPVEKRCFRGTITGALAALDEHAPFAGAIELFDAGGDPGAAITDLTEGFARALLANARDPLTAIVFVHGVTSSAALRALAPHLDAATSREVLGYAWQAGAALYATFGSHEPVWGEVEAPAGDDADRVERAVASGDEHAIKLVAACLGEFAHNPSPAYPAAVAQALDLVART